MGLGRCYDLSEKGCDRLGVVMGLGSSFDWFGVDVVMVVWVVVMMGLGGVVMGLG